MTFFHELTKNLNKKNDKKEHLIGFSTEPLVHFDYYFYLLLTIDVCLQIWITELSTDMNSAHALKIPLEMWLEYILTAITLVQITMVFQLWKSVSSRVNSFAAIVPHSDLFMVPLSPKSKRLHQRCKRNIKMLIFWSNFDFLPFSVCKNSWRTRSMPWILVSDFHLSHTQIKYGWKQMTVIVVALANAPLLNQFLGLKICMIIMKLRCIWIRI